MIRNNRCTGGFFGNGGGISLGTAIDCLIEDNKVLPGGDPSQRGGGAINADLLRCIVRGNIAPDGGGIYGGTADRCTIVHNVAPGTPFSTDASGVANAIVTNSILWGNEPVEQQFSTLTDCNVQDSTPGVGNFSAAPELFGPGSDVHLLASSPCIDAGDPAAAPDPDGSRADVGALPFDPSHVREDAPFCFGVLDLEVTGEVSVSVPTAVLASPGVTGFIVSANSGYTPLVFVNPFNSTQASGLCLFSPFTRILPSASGELAITTTVLDRLGLVPGDRLYVQAFRTIQGIGVETSQGLDLGVMP